jgi:hypothetical protein
MKYSNFKRSKELVEKIEYWEQKVKLLKESPVQILANGMQFLPTISTKIKDSKNPLSPYANRFILQLTKHIETDIKKMYSELDKL